MSDFAGYQQPAVVCHVIAKSGLIPASQQLPGSLLTCFQTSGSQVPEKDYRCVSFANVVAGELGMFGLRPEVPSQRCSYLLNTSEVSPIEIASTLGA